MKIRNWILVILILLVLFVSFTTLGKMILNDFVLFPLLSPHSQQCGWNSGPNPNPEQAKWMNCKCDGIKLEKSSFGPTNYYCYGKCSGCECFNMTGKIDCNK